MTLTDLGWRMELRTDSPLGLGRQRRTLAQWDEQGIGTN